MKKREVREIREVKNGIPYKGDYIIIQETELEDIQEYLLLEIEDEKIEGFLNSLTDCSFQQEKILDILEDNGLEKAIELLEYNYPKIKVLDDNNQAQKRRELQNKKVRVLNELLERVKKEDIILSHDYPIKKLVLDILGKNTLTEKELKDLLVGVTTEAEIFLDVVNGKYKSNGEFEETLVYNGGVR